MKKLFLISIFFILLNADIKFVTVESIGFAASKQDAIENALINAVAKVNGLSISSAKIVVKESVKSKIYVGNSSRTIKVLSKAQAQAIASKASGAVYSYRIIYLNRSDYGYEAKVAAVIAKYKSPGLNPRNRRSLAILPFEYKPTYFIFGITINGKELSDRLTQSIVNKITQTRKFTVLDRENSKYYQIEKSFLTSGNSDPIELVRLGKRLGADYFVIGKILDLDVYKNTTTNYYTGERTSKNKAFATISYRILNIPTQQIKWSDTIDIEFTIPNKKRLESLVVKIGDKIAQELVDQIIYNIYPPKIIDATGDSVIINIGGKFMHKGDRFKVFALGKRLYDPYTKEFLGQDEIEMGQIEITNVRPKISYGKILYGSAVKGAILRKFETKKSSSKNLDGKKESMFELMFSR